MNIIQRSSLPIYQQLSTFLLQTYRAKYLLQRIPPSSLLRLTEDNELATQALREEVGEIARRRRTTEDKYEKRLEFLRAKMRGAVLKEGLRR